MLIDALCKAERGERIFNIDARIAFSHQASCTVTIVPFAVAKLC